MYMHVYMYAYMYRRLRGADGTVELRDARAQRGDLLGHEREPRREKGRRDGAVAAVGLQVKAMVEVALSLAGVFKVGLHLP